MKYIIFTFNGEGLPLAKHLQDEGQEVIVGQVENFKSVLTTMEKRRNGEESTFKKNRRLSLYKNLVEKIPVDMLLKKMKRIKNKKEYFVFFDFNHLFRYAEQVKEMGFIHGNFPTEKDRLFEIDRDGAKDFVKKYYPYIKITEKEEFRSIHRAKIFLKNTDSSWVIKGKSENALTFIPTTNDVELAKYQVIETMEAFKDYYEESGFILEQKISSPIEITPEKIYYDGVPLAMNLDFENKPIGSGNISIQTYCAQDLVFPVSMESKIHDICFPPIVDKLAKRHKGLFVWDASLLIDKQTGTIYFGEFCPNRVGYNAFYTDLCQLPSTSYFFEQVVRKKSPFTLGTVGSSVTFFNILRDPHERNILSGASIDYTSDVSKNVWPFDIYKKKKTDKMRIVGSDWYLAVVTGAATTIDEAVRNLYKNVEQCSFPGAYYRPKSDYLSMDYPTSILNRLRYGLQKKLYTLPFPVTF